MKAKNKYYFKNRKSLKINKQRKRQKINSHPYIDKNKK